MVESSLNLDTRARSRVAKPDSNSWEVRMAQWRVSLRAVRGWRLAAVAGFGSLIVIAAMALPALERLRAQAKEVRWLRQRLADRREVIRRQQAEMSQVAAAADRVVRAAAAVRDRNAQVRRLANLEESRAPESEPVVTLVTADGNSALVSEDAATALRSLAWVEGQLSATGESIGVLTALLPSHPAHATGSLIPTLWPVRGFVTSSFGARSSPYGGGREIHPGIDIKARYGFPVEVAGDGEVIFAGRDPGYGACVVIDHGKDVQTLYGHLSAIYVREGQRVRRGDAIGALGATGRATGAHLHYEIRVAGQPVDPMRFLRN
jgi:murein DD-endopeptidase MepM/ murein hydrolase activator NlpD